ncbi:alkaline phosphatase family protein [Paenibacillus sp. N4]|nr:alkaline phosphatase family protein [Paenibacillus vietnamensis]
MFFLLTLFVLASVSGCQARGPGEQDLLRIQSAGEAGNKKVILIVVDSLMAQSIDRGIRQNRLPAFQFLIGRGQYYKEMVSSFPTMSVTIDSSLITGAYPDEHRVPGLTWYSMDDRRLINYGTGPMEVLHQGGGPVLSDALVHLNRSHLNGKLPTIYDELARRGFTSGSVNGLIYRGQTNHTLSIPGWMQAVSPLPDKIQVIGPDFLSLGVLSNPLEGAAHLPVGPFGRFGLNNSFAIETVSYLVRTKALPDFLYVYLPDLDQKLHRNGPSDMAGVEKTDRQLQNLLEAFGSPEQALNEAVFLIMGDSGMTPILPAAQQPEIDLPALLGPERVLSPGEKVSERTELVTAVNETMAYVYALKENQPLKNTAELLLTDPRIDFVAWKEKEWIRVIQASTLKQLKYKAGGGLKDSYNQAWTIEQDGTVLDLKVNTAGGSVAYGDYPDALRRLSGALHSQNGEFLIVTAKPGYELADKSSPSHKGGGGHGAMYRMESLVPLIISETGHRPKYLRIVDLKAFLLDLVTKQKGQVQ